MEGDAMRRHHPGTVKAQLQDLPQSGKPSPIAAEARDRVEAVPPRG